MPGEETLCHMSLSKLLCRYDDVETVYAAKILSDYLTGSNEAPAQARISRARSCAGRDA